MIIGKCLSVSGLPTFYPQIILKNHKICLTPKNPKSKKQKTDKQKQKSEKLTSPASKYLSRRQLTGRSDQYSRERLLGQLLFLLLHLHC
jgi:hypothetical protein